MSYKDYRDAVINRFELEGYTRSPLTFEQIANLYQMGADIGQAVSIAEEIVRGISADRAFERNL